MKTDKQAQKVLFNYFWMSAIFLVVATLALGWIFPNLPRPFLWALAVNIILLLLWETFCRVVASLMVNPKVVRYLMKRGESPISVKRPILRDSNQDGAVISIVLLMLISIGSVIWSTTRENKVPQNTQRDARFEMQYPESCTDEQTKLWDESEQKRINILLKNKKNTADDHHSILKGAYSKNESKFDWDREAAPLDSGKGDGWFAQFPQVCDQKDYDQRFSTK